MRMSRPLALAGAAALIAGLGVAAYAEAPKVHVLKVALPDGSVERIRYTGDTPPRVVMVADPAAAMVPMMPMDFGGLDRIAAEMDAHMAAMMHQAEAMQQTALTGGGVQATGAAPAGTQFSYVSTTTVNGRTCTTSVRQVAGKDGAQPQMLRQVSGDGCDAAARAPQGVTPTALPAPPAAPLAPKPPKAPAVPRDTI